ncbi:hypothetical protein BGT96224_A20540 [Blumeria graminis f. sp. tritici 96224]|nr:hypothetical protein BGT96224_A20540 [Blumeria graminis f. sp. tritici 96224]
MWKPARYFTKIHTNQLLTTRKCSEKKLVDLALQGHITINGNYGLHTSTRNGNAPVVIFDEPLKIKRIILDNSFISMAEYNGLKYALAWYQGHPHVFSRRLDEENNQYGTAVPEPHEIGRREMAGDWPGKIAGHGPSG